MKWRRSKLFYEMDGREIEVTAGSVIEAPATVMHKFVDATKLFRLGERIRLTVDEFNEVMFHLQRARARCRTQACCPIDPSGHPQLNSPPDTNCTAGRSRERCLRNKVL
jgi:hypothetical protein